MKIEGRLILFSVWTVMCPPIFLDWEEILRNFTDWPDVFTKEPWERPLPRDLGDPRPNFTCCNFVAILRFRAHTGFFTRSETGFG